MREQDNKSDVYDDDELPHKTLAELSTNALELEMNERDFCTAADLIDEWVEGEPINPHLCSYISMLMYSISTRAEGVVPNPSNPDFIQKMASVKQDYEIKSFLGDTRHTDEELDEWLQKPLEVGDTVYVVTPRPITDKPKFDATKARVVFADEEVFNVQIDVDDKPLSLEFFHETKLPISEESGMRIYPNEDDVEYYIERLTLISEIEDRIKKGKNSYTEGLNKIDFEDLESLNILLGSLGV